MLLTWAGTVELLPRGGQAGHGVSRREDQLAIAGLDVEPADVVGGLSLHRRASGS